MRPDSDPSAVGYIGLCNQAGQQLTSGNVNTKPFAWRALSSQPAGAPLQQCPAHCGSRSRISHNQACPPASGVATNLPRTIRVTRTPDPDGSSDLRLRIPEDFIQDFHPKWDGFLQLRIYLGTQDQQTYSLHYPVLNIQVKGDTWRGCRRRHRQLPVRKRGVD